MAADPRHLKDLFHAAVDLSDHEARDAFLDRECCDDPELRSRLSELLAANDQPMSALERPLGADLGTMTFVSGGRDPSTTKDEPGTIVAGRYKRLELIGEGGMGQVWVVEQLEPIRRRVALKLIKPGMDSRTVLARFEAERQALALMDHPNIAKVLDAGSTDDGRPFFVMELVKGVPITEFCDARRLTPRERLALFIPVCQAVQHAHQKGIIHRDLKPSNVLVALHDETPVPKVIDFGVAKAVGQPLTESTLYTGFGSLVGTPAYMAPEQATFNQLDIDTRADVYALGILLYELLAGSPPFEPERLKRAAFDEVLRMVREEEPPRPSARLSSSETRASIAAVRRSEPETLARLVRGDLDWIVMKALDKDRNRRYDTAAAFAADVRRHLEGEAVQAHPPSPGYRLRKFARKHRLAIGTASAFAALLVAATAVAGYLAVQARHSKVLADAERTRAVDAARRADTARRTVERGAIDLDLAQLPHDRPFWSLRLARDLRALPARGDDLREFVSSALLAVGQDYAPLLPPLTHDGQEIHRFELAPDRRTALTLGVDGTARLWDPRTARPIAVLRHGGEHVVGCTYSPDSRTIVTDDRSGVVRFWNTTDGTFRAGTEPRPDRYATARTEDRRRYQAVELFSPASARLSDRRILTARKVDTDHDDGTSDSAEVGPFELWDTATGRRIAQLDLPEKPERRVGLLGGGRWVAAVVGSAVLLFSAEDGRRVTRLEQPEAQYAWFPFTDPDARRIASVVEEPSGLRRLRIWDADRSWTLSLDATNSKIARTAPVDTWPVDEWWGEHAMAATEATEFGIFRTVYLLDGELSVARGNFDGAAHLLLPRGEIAWLHDRLFETRTGRQLQPPRGRLYPPELARFAPGGRFVVWIEDEKLPGSTLIDLRSERAVDLWSTYAHLEGFGLVGFESATNGYKTNLRILPTEGPGDLPAELLELWLKVAYRGEIDAEGRFTTWDEPTWQSHREQLASSPPPIPELPFPGRLAHDSLHWLRLEFQDARTEPERLRVATELLRRAEKLHDPAEAARWRNERDAIAERVTGKDREE